MDKRELIYIIIAVLGWSWGVLQFFLKRKIVKKDKIVDRRFDAYSTYLKKSDELMNNVRTDPNMIYGIFPELFKGIVSGDSNAADNALIHYRPKIWCAFRIRPFHLGRGKWNPYRACIAGRARCGQKPLRLGQPGDCRARPEAEATTQRD